MESEMITTFEELKALYPDAKEVHRQSFRIVMDPNDPATPEPLPSGGAPEFPLVEVELPISKVKLEEMLRVSS